jgi:hypothetical protein
MIREGKGKEGKGRERKGGEMAFMWEQQLSTPRLV